MALRQYLAVSSSFLTGSRAMSAMYSSCCRISIKGPSFRWSQSRTPPVSSPVAKTFSSTSSRLLMGALEKQIQQFLEHLYPSREL